MKNAVGWLTNSLYEQVSSRHMKLGANGIIDVTQSRKFVILVMNMSAKLRQMSKICARNLRSPSSFAHDRASLHFCSLRKRLTRSYGSRRNGRNNDGFISLFKRSRTITHKSTGKIRIRLLRRILRGTISSLTC